MADLLIANARLLDPVAGELLPDASVRVEGATIVEVTVGAGTPAVPDGVPVLDARGATVMPGLIDAHVHAAITTLDIQAMTRRHATRVGLEARVILERMLRRGFTTVRDAGGLDIGITEALAVGLISGPRVLRSGRVLSQTGGHGDTTLPVEHPAICACQITSSSFSHVADGPDAVRRAVREELKGGAQQIKVMAGGGVATPSDPIDMVQYTEAEIRAAVEEAQARRTYVFAHAYIPEAIMRAVRAGVRSIEHGNLIDDESAAQMAEHGTFLVPTLVTYDQIAEFGRTLGFPAASLAKLDAVLGAGLASVETALRAGVRLGFGTDLLGETHDAQSKEFLLRAQVQPAADVIRSATVVNAELLGMAGQVGVASPGARADLLVVDGDPFADLGVLGGQGDHLDLVMRDGEVIVNRLA